MTASPRRLAAGVVLLGLIGCTSVGPPTVSRDRLDYAAAVADAAKRETLLNLVKLRYADVPSLVTVSQLVAGYSLEGRIDLGSNFFANTFDFSDDVSVGVGGTFSDHPTITYTPIKGDDFARVMLTPIPPSQLFAMIAAGTPADLALGLGVQSINGLRNWAADSRGLTQADAGFAEAIGLLDQLRRDAILGFHFETRDSAQTVVMWMVPRSDQPLDPRARRLMELLDLDPAVASFPIHFGLGEGRTDIGVSTRSLIEVLGNLGARVEVPAEHAAAGRTYPTRLGADDPQALPALSVRTSDLRPLDAFVAAGYRGTWYWIDDRDFESKRVFGIVMLLLNLAEKTDETQLPVITIPTG